jgi:hypothetical protein
MFINSVVCLMTSPYTLPKRVLQRVQSSTSSYNFQYLLVSLRSSSSCLRLLSRLPVTYILSFICPSITCFRRRFLCKMWPIQSSLLLFIVCMIFVSSLTLRNTWSFLTQSVQLIRLCYSTLSEANRVKIRQTCSIFSHTVLLHLHNINVFYLPTDAYLNCLKDFKILH